MMLHSSFSIPSHSMPFPPFINVYVYVYGYDGVFTWIYADHQCLLMCLECFSLSAKRPWKITAFATAPLLHSSAAHIVPQRAAFWAAPHRNPHNKINRRSTSTQRLGWVHFFISSGMWCCDGGGADKVLPLVVGAVADIVVEFDCCCNNVNRKWEEKTQGMYVCWKNSKEME